MRLVFSVVFPGTRFSARVLQIIGHFETTGQNSSIKDLLCSYVLFILIQPSCTSTSIHIYRVSQEERTKLREGVPYVKIYRYNPKHLYPKLNGYGDNGKRSLKL